jgi:hypothetical protein
MYSFSVAMTEVNGRTGNVNTDSHMGGKDIISVTSIGRDDPTMAEVQCAATVLRILHGSEKALDALPWIKNIWFPPDDNGPLIWPKEWSEEPKPSQDDSDDLKPYIRKAVLSSILPLNRSQQRAVNYMLSSEDDNRITLIQGPPGTGKTSVIAAFVQRALRLNKEGIWLIAYSNIAVKNIAEKLMSVGFENWKLLVSNDFHGW